MIVLQVLTLLSYYYPYSHTIDESSLLPKLATKVLE